MEKTSRAEWYLRPEQYGGTKAYSVQRSRHLLRRTGNEPADPENRPSRAGGRVQGGVRRLCWHNACFYLWLVLGLT